MTTAGLPSIEERVETLLAAVAMFKRPCKGCGETLYFVRHTESGNVAPYTKEAVNHFANCPKANEFKRKAMAKHA